MSANLTVDPEDIAELIGRCKLSVSVSEFHGSLVGYIAGGGRFPGDSVLAALSLEPDPAPTADEEAMLNRLRHQTDEWLADPELTFSPWLPDDDAPIPERAEGLVDWIHGFLGGLGLGGSVERNQGMSDDAREVLKDMASIAATEFEFDADDDVNDESLTELEEFVRAGAMLLHAELSRGMPPANDTLH
ncbi:MULTISPECIES: UPF0149 family protein [unclassified Luteibacter]|uniref:UPF0149 family protein n=1 Tax=unclassified Luteibacter TaxID=2620188 RepID=UPI0008D3D89B|nr:MULTISPECIES: UPF0149 family protein [unclassified Luteibacter]MDR6937162.1 uncharacterized protein YgfB (UPF0149 family) [Luteibacter sp. 3190]SEO44592.1 hypothetical protein SAMN02800692_0818 [Luteibacter sp. UNC138MFCol5.1]